MQLSRPKDKTGVGSCIPVSNLMQLRAANTAVLAHRSRFRLLGHPESTPKGDVYEVRERCEGGGCRGSSRWNGRLYGPEASPGPGRRSEGSSGQAWRRSVFREKLGR